MKRLGFIQAITLAAGVTGAVVLAGGWLVSLIGCGDVVPSTGAGRVLGVALMLTGFACLAFVTATMASMIVSEVRAEERLIQREESEVLALLAEMNARLERLERLGDASPSGDRLRAGQAGRG